MSEKFPIANRIRHGAQFEVFLDYGRDMLVVEEVQEALIKNTFAFFDVNMASKLYWQGKKDYYRLSDDFGSLRPPFGRIWMEWTIPFHVQIDGQWLDREETTQHAAIVELVPRNNATMTMRQIQFMIIPTDKDRVIFLPHGQQITLDAITGMFIPGYENCQRVLPDKEAADESNAEARELVAKLFDPNVPWMALNLINCRNVITRQTGSVFTRSGREKRQGAPVTRYNTIVLPGMQTRYVGAKGASQEHRDMAAHMARGHFKTYTAERPLLGKHVGTYWWGWQTRGNPERGQVVSDYKLGETG